VAWRTVLRLKSFKVNGLSGGAAELSESKESLVIAFFISLAIFRLLVRVTER
jgi:hypothetical protein